jgi:uncharacterized protein (DUF1697 family)
VPRYVALLRGVNVGGKNKLPMADLREMAESLGHTEVSTYIQSGNVVFTAARSVKPERWQAAIAKQFDLNVTVVLRTASELDQVVKANPFARADVSKLHVGFMTQKPSAPAIAKLDVDRFAPDEVAVHGRELYFHLPNGMGRSQLPPFVDRQLKIPTTVRNWNTVTKLLELAG